ncbi:MAG: FAD-dependent monooxygenase [Firmicutes bacterium]|nr:FAD-dependent monooxygenase [Bacillota bacterium]
MSALKENYDVIIVGSGPAGAAAAKTFCHSGLDVVIIEKCPLPRDKMCSGVILPSARKFLEQHYDDLPEHIFTTPRTLKCSRYVRMNDDQSRVMSFPALDLAEDPSDEYGFNVSRSAFDLWLCEASGAALADNCFLIDYKEEPENITVQVKHNGKYMEIKAKYLIGADGTISRVRRTLAPELEQSLNWIALYEEHYECQIDLEPGWMYWILDQHSFGSILHKGKNLHITAATTWGETAKNLLKRYVNFLTAQHGLKIAKTTMTRGIIMNDQPFRGDYLLGKGNILLVGEAAGFVRALDGITSALVTGKATGESVLQSIQSGKTALDYYSQHELVVAEQEICNKSHLKMAELGFPAG